MKKKAFSNSTPKEMKRKGKVRRSRDREHAPHLSDQARPHPDAKAHLRGRQMDRWVGVGGKATLRRSAWELPSSPPETEWVSALTQESMLLPPGVLAPPF